MHASAILQARVDELAKELPGITFGYIGNVERWGDDRTWFVFLPHPGRVGEYTDSVRVGTTLELDACAERSWPVVEARARQLYPLGNKGISSRRVG